MLALLGFLTVAALFVLIVTRLASPLVALIAVPVAAALMAGFGLGTAKFIVSGVQQIAPVAVMFVFAILYFGVITDAGTLEPIINAIVRGVGARPPRVVAGSALLALLVHLDGSGAVTFLVAIPCALTGYVSQQNFDAQWISTQAKDAMNSVGIGAFFNLLNFGQMYSYHVFLLPLAVVALFVVHVLLVRKHGVVPPYRIADRMAAFQTAPSDVDGAGSEPS